MQAFVTGEGFEGDGSMRVSGARGVSETEGGVRIRQMTDADLKRISELRAAVRWAADPRTFDLLRGMRVARWAVAEASDGTLAGMVGAVPMVDVGILCHLAVRGDHREMGLGTRLSAWAIAYLRSSGVRTVRLYSTHQAEGLYSALGFRASARRVVYRLERAWRRDQLQQVHQQSAGYRVETLTVGDLPELYGLDYWSYGADRSALIFAVLRLHPGRGLVARDATGRIKGYVIRSSAGRNIRIGPFVAADPDVAGLLLGNALRENEGTPVEVTVPGPDDSPAHVLLKEFGFVGREDRLLMELGNKPNSGNAGLIQYGTTSYLAT